MSHFSYCPHSEQIVLHNTDEIHNTDPLARWPAEPANHRTTEPPNHWSHRRPSPTELPTVSSFSKECLETNLLVYG
ncbi:hypothetical protein C500_01995 [Natrialba magadii ATCC 43099]|uniref:Uncharacterized protein n=1 Tax=Natrialba magadii (strain ATCC 43099 / DSM 3394 / CCM 3739 / CIP 104546 / IAM 13178 / JCM 8861 / NBRC 102185 / NCIMB 2190 / MS3) TaxID=547559 RepID=L9V8M1_NATMM|nr:hypothetical protein C500_01995 [Natrialba magadii ATCC 43099]